MSARRGVLLAAGALMIAPRAVAQQTRVWRIGLLGATSEAAVATRLGALRRGLSELGYVEGRNIAIEARWAQGQYERLPELASELVRQRVDVIVTYGTPGASAAKRATATIPIVMATSGDAVATGLVASFARPGGNLTGSSFHNPELAAKGVELLKAAAPRTTQIAVLLKRGNPINPHILAAIGDTARALQLKMGAFEVTGVDDLPSAFEAMAAAHADAVVVHEDPLLNANVNAIAPLATRHRLPSAGFVEFADAGGLIGYGVDFPAMWHRAASFVDKILKGAHPRDIPVEQPAKFEVVVNLAAARALGIKVPVAVLQRADRVIE